MGTKPQLAHNQKGDPYLRIPVAVNGRDDRTDWANCVCFGKYAETMAKYLTKGREIAVAGRLQVSQRTAAGFQDTQAIAAKVKELKAAGKKSISLSDLEGLLSEAKNFTYSSTSVIVDNIHLGSDSRRSTPTTDDIPEQAGDPGAASNDAPPFS